MIHTLEWLRKEAEGISGHWNGEDARYVDHNGDVRTDEEAQAAGELLEAIKKIDALTEELGL